MEFRQLKYFLTVLQYGSINRAAAALNVSQPSLSHSIKALERSVGAELLVRGGSGIRPSAIGETFERYARNILREAKKAEDEVAAMRGGGAGRIAIGSLSVFQASFFPKVMGRFLAETPSVTVEAYTFTFNSEPAIRNVQRAEWDLALTLLNDGTTLPADIEARVMSWYPSTVFCNAAHPLAGAVGVTARQLAESEWVMTTSGGADAVLKEALPQSGPLRVRMRANSMNLALAVTRQYPVLCMAPIEAAAADVAAGRLVRVDQSLVGSTARIAILHSNLAERTSAMRAFMVACSAEAETLPG